MAKKSKPVKKALVKKTAPKKAPIAIGTKKAAAKPAVAAKKPVAKKALVKKSAAKKTAQPVAVKKAAVKKPVAKKPVAKKATPVKAIPPKQRIKKTAPVKSVAKPVPPVVKKKAAKPKSLPVNDSLPPVTELSEELLEKAANTGSKPITAPGNGSNEANAITEDPIKSFDKNVFNKATAKGDPHSKLHLSSKPKNSIKPSGKKPLW